MKNLLLASLLLFAVNAHALTIYTVDDFLTDMSDVPSDADCAAHASNADTLLIDEDSDWSSINDSGITKFCVVPGDYAVNVDLTTSGTSGTRRYIRLYDTTDPKVPGHTDTVDGDRAIIDRLYYLADYWTVTGLTVHGATGASVRMQPGNDNNILDNFLVENSGGGAGQVAGGGANNVVQNGVIRNSMITVSGDDHCLVHYGANMKVVFVEMYNCAGDTIQVSAAATGGVIAFNEMYVTSAYYTNDDYSTNGLDPTGDHMCVENGIDFKGGGSGSFPFSEANQLRVIGNKTWGFNRDDDNSCVGGGAGTRGLAWVLHQQAEGIYMAQNFFSSDGDSSVSTNIESVALITANVDLEDSTFINNLYENLDYVHEMPGSKSASLEYYYETYLNIGQYKFSSAGDTSDYQCNVFVNVADDGVTTQGSGDLYDYNAYYNSDDTDIGNTNDEDYATAAESNNSTYTWVRHQITNPTKVNVSLASTTAASPHADLCDNPTETASRGVDNVDQLTRTQAGFQAPNTRIRNPFRGVFNRVFRGAF